MAWFGDGLSSLSNLKGQITNFTKEVLSEGIVEETDKRTIELNEANEKCVQLQEILNSKDAEISLLRRQNCELQKAVVELNARPQESNDANSLDDEGGGGFFWDPPPVKNHDGIRNPNRTSVLEERLSQATLKIRELEDELTFLRASPGDKKDEITDGHRKAEFLRAKQDMLNRIIQIGEKSRDAEKNFKRLPLDESTLINDFQTAISKLDSYEKSCMIKNALRALNSTQHEDSSNEKTEKFHIDEKREKFDRPHLESISLLSNNDDADIQNGITENGNTEANNYPEFENLTERIRELEQENACLTTSLDELDKEHAQSLDTIIVMKDQLQKKHESLQNAYEQLYVEYNEAQMKLQLLSNESKIVTGIEANNNSISENSGMKKPKDIFNLEKQVQTDIRNCETNSVFVQTMTRKNIDKDCQTIANIEIEAAKENNSSNVDVDRTSLVNLTARINEILKNCHIETNENETIFETLANNYVEANWKKEMLERKLTETSRELKEMSEMRDTLQIDCYDMQTNIESLLLKIEHLKSNLPSIPEASEERVASLETETESMNEEIKRLKSEHESLKIKHYELITTTSILEGSLRNQENLEAELRNTKQQLNMAEQRLDGASKNVENNENMMEDLSRRLHSSLEENNDLRKINDSLEIAKRQAYDECSKITLDYNEKISKLENEIENLTRELYKAHKNIEKLENDIVIITEAKNELEKDIEAISEEKEHLETESLVLRENSSEKETNELLNHLRDQLKLVDLEKSNLEHDLVIAKNKLDEIVERCSMMEMKIIESNNENTRLSKENKQLMEQLSNNHKETEERIELLQAELNLLNQEYSSLKNERTSEISEISKLGGMLEDTSKKRDDLEKELSITMSKLDSLRTDYEEIKIQAKSSVLLEKEIDSLKSIKNDYHRSEEKCESLQKELTKLLGIEEELKLLRGTHEKLEKRCEEMKIVENKFFEMEKRCEEMKIVENKFLEMEKRCHELDEQLACAESEKHKLREINEEKIKKIAELSESIEKLELLRSRVNENASMAKETIESLSKLVKEKDEEIERLNREIATNRDKKHDEEETAIANLKAEREEFVRLVQEKHNTSLQYYAEIERLAQLLNEQTTNLQQIVAERDEKTTKLAEKDAEILWSQNELKVVRQRLKSLEESQNYSETCNIVEHSRQIAQSAIINEKCKALEAALIQEQSSNRIIQNQLTESQSREANAAKELERLRTHLVEMEASYTEEALIAEENRKQLESKLLQAEEKAQNSSTVYTSASIRANQQVETLQQQMSLIIQQRDEIQAKLSVAEDKVLSHTASLTNLQIVLEQFQRDKENDICTATEKLRQQLNMSYKDQEDLRNEIVNLRTQLSEAKECLQAASRLSEQLDKKSERIEELNGEVAKLTELVNTADQRIQEATSNEEGKVDKNLVKNLLLGFLTSSTMDKSSVLRVFATVLEFDETEREKIGLNHPTANSGWFSGLLGSGGSAPTKDQEASLSAAFVRFLESESKPKPQLPALTISNSSLSRPGHSRQHSSSSTQSGLLLSSITLPSFPDFVPSRNTGSILKEVLKDS